MTAALRLAIPLAALLTLGGCGLFSSPENVVKPAELRALTPTAAFGVRWHVSVGESGASLLQPALTADAVYGASGDGELTRIDRANGKQLWRIDTGIKLTGGVGAGEGLVLVGGDKGEVLAYDENGKQRWKTKVSSEVLSAPKVVEGVVVVRSGDGRIVGLDAADGKRRWLYEHATPALVVRSHAGVTIRNGMGYAGFAGGKLFAFRPANGSALWETAVSLPRGNTELERISDVTSDPAGDDHQVCAIAFQGRIACFDPMQGSPLWNREISSDKGVTLQGRQLYLSDASGVVMALDKASGGTLWKNELLLNRDVSTPQASGNVVVVGDFEGYLHALSRDDGRIVARIKLDGPVRAAPQQMDDGLLVQTTDGGIYSLSIK